MEELTFLGREGIDLPTNCVIFDQAEVTVRTPLLGLYYGKKTRVADDVARFERIFYSWISMPDRLWMFLVKLCPEKQDPRTRWFLSVSNQEGQSDLKDRDKTVAFPTKMSVGRGVCRDFFMAQ